MAKYDGQFKLKVVLDYLSGRVGGYKTVARKYGIVGSTVQLWTDSYRLHGALGVRPKGASYGAAFKLSVLERMQREMLSLRQTAALFDIRHAGHIAKWQQQYNEGAECTQRPTRSAKENGY